MSGMSVFNVWDSQASNRTIEKAAEKITGTIEKSTGKLSTDIKQNADKMTDAIKKVATTNASGNSVPATAATIYKGLQDVSTATAHIAEHLRNNPGDLPATTEAADAIGKRFGELVEAATQFEAGSMKLRCQVEEMGKAQDWIACKFPNAADDQTVAVNNATSFVSDLRVFNF